MGKILCGLLICVLTSTARAERDVQVSECLPAGVTWPVRAIYLHGLFKARGADSNGFRELEAQNRVALEQTAQRLQIRIAVPVSPAVNGAGFRFWNPRSLSQIEEAARTSCGGDLSPSRVFIGFSNGGYRVRNLSREHCRDLTSYARLIAIGLEPSRGSECETLDQVERHEFPPRKSEYNLDEELASALL